MSNRYTFSHQGVEYEVAGNYGVSNTFIVTQQIPGGAGMPNSTSVRALVSGVNTPDELLNELRNKFSGLADFAPF